MTGFLEILVVAFGAQLAVLPGEKVQFIIAGLSTKYHPLLVVSAAGTAFAGWTALEIVFGNALQQALSPTLLNGFTAGLFVLFAYLLWRSAPAPGADPAATDGGTATTAGVDGVTRTDEGIETDVSVLGREVPDYLGGFVPIFAMMTAGEFGDKTQIVTIGLAAKYGATPAIWVGEMLAIVPVSLANAYFFHRFSHRFDLRKAHLFSVALFGFFAFDTVLGMATKRFTGESFTVWETIVNAFADVVLALLALV